MRAIPLKPGYGPTLDQLLAPRWRAAPLALRVAAVVAVVAIAVAAFALVRALRDTTYSQRTPIALHFRYRDLSRRAPYPGGYVRVASSSGRRLSDSFAVGPLHLPAYRGSVTGALPLYAARYIDALRSHDRDFDLLGEGHVRINKVPGYAVDYTERVGAQKLNGRDVLMVPPAPAGARDGVVIQMLTKASEDINAMSPVATGGPLHLALRTFRFG